jgi:hypothetical protein
LLELATTRPVLSFIERRSSYRILANARDGFLNVIVERQSQEGTDSIETLEDRLIHR